MSQLISITAKLQPVHKKLRSSGGYAVAYTYDASREGLGNLLVIAEITTPSKQAEEVADLIIQTVGEHYYDTADTVGTNPLDNLEAALRAVNQTLHDYTNVGHGNWVGKLSAIIGVLQNGELHFSQAGSARMFLFRSDKSREITQPGNAGAVAVPLKTFSQIASGSLKDSDKVLLATPALFHLMAMNQIRQIVSDNTPQQSAEKIKSLIVRSSDNDRVSGIILEIATPQSAAVGEASSPDSETFIEPKVKLGATATAHAGPILRKAADISKRGGRYAKGFTVNQIWPRLRWVLLQMVAGLRKLLRNKLTARLVVVGVVLAIILTGWIVQRQFESGALTRLEKRYDNLVKQADQADQLATSGNKNGARQLLTSVQDGLKGIAADPDAKKLEADLSQKSKTDASIVLPAQLATAVNSRLDQLDSLIHAATTVVHNLASLSSAKPHFMQTVGSKLVLFNDSAGITATTLDLTSVTLKTGATSTEAGKIVATAASSAGDGAFILTDKPSIWFWRDSDGSLLEQTISFGSWPKGLSIASYNSNLYLLGTDGKQISKFSRTLSGFSGASSYFEKDVTQIASANALAVDGNIYTMGQSGLKRYLSGTLKLSSDALPASIAAPNQLLSYPTANLVLGVDAKTGHLSTFTSTDDSLTFLKQYDAGSAGAIHGVMYDSRTKQVYALTESAGIVRFNLN